MSIKSKIEDFVKSMDLFPSSQFIRYKKDSEYKTTLGGVASVLIIAVTIALFINMGLQTVNKTLIASAIS